MRILDLGGREAAWRLAPVAPAQVVSVNLGRPPQPELGWFRAIEGDACELPAAIRTEAFDAVFSNSVIEHVGGHDRRKAFAESVLSSAPRHWVQTPNRYFPLEPHWLGPGFQFLPVELRTAAISVWPLSGYRGVTDRRQLLSTALEVELLSATELAYYFPGSQMLRERFVGLTKSLIAVR
jgi:hypothetical protein